MPAGQPVQTTSEESRLVGNLTSAGYRALESNFSGRKVPLIQSEPAGRQCRQSAFRGSAGNTGPRHEGTIAVPRRHLAVTEPVLHVTAPGPALGQSDQPFSGLAKPLGTKLTLCRLQLASELTVSNQPHRQPGNQAEPDRQDQHAT